MWTLCFCRIQGIHLSACPYWQNLGLGKWTILLCLTAGRVQNGRRTSKDLKFFGTCFVMLHHCFHFQGLTMHPLRGYIFCSVLVEYWLKYLQESMDMCTGRHDITEILLKTALYTIQSITIQY